MPLQLHFASQLEQFLKPLLKTLKKATQSTWGQSLSTPLVIAGTPLIQRWLNIKMAEEWGLLMGLEVQTLEKTLWNLLEKSKNDRTLSVATLEHAVLNQLKECTELNDPLWDSLKLYLLKDGQIQIEKWVQLAKYLSRAFLEYELNRPAGGKDLGMLKNWELGNSYLEPILSQRSALSKQAKEAILNEENTQRALWSLLQKKLNSMNSSGDRLVSLPMLWAENRQLSWPKMQAFKNQKMVIFGLPGQSHFHRNAILELSQFFDIEVFLLNPCAEFWEDLNTQKHKNKHKKPPQLNSEQYICENYESLIDNLGYSDFEDQKLLELWGASDKENLTLWGQFASEDQDLEFLNKPEFTNDSLLQEVQSLILYRQNRSENPHPILPFSEYQNPKFDASLMTLSAPTALREMESLRDLILGMMDPEHPLYIKGLRPDDFCLFLPDPKAYQSALEQSFFQGSSLHYLPVHLVQGAGSSSLFGEAILAFLKLLRGEFNRNIVFDFLRNPLVMLELKINRETLSLWENWASELKIFRAYNLEERVQLGDFEPTREHTWSHGFDRIIAGWLSHAPLLDGEVLPWTGAITDQSDDLALFIQTIKNLHRTLENIRQERKNSKNFVASEFMRSLQPWIDSTALSGAEQSIQLEFFKTLESLEQVPEVSLDLLISWAKNSLENEIPPAPSRFPGSMVIAPLRVGHALPHKVILIAGLNSDFPGKSNRTSLDLLKHCRILGDADSVRNNQAGFLHTLLAAQKRLILSYTDRDIQKDQELFASSVLTELQSFVKNNMAQSPQGEHSQIPHLKAPLLNRNSELFGPEQVLFRYDKALIEAMEKPLLSPLELKEEIRKNQIQLKDLKNFILSPLDFRVKSCLGIYDEDIEDASEIDHEPLTWNSLEKTQHLSVLAQKCLNQLIQPDNLDQSLEQCLQEFAEDLRKQGFLPEGLFAKKMIFGMSQFIQEFAQNFKKLATQYPEHHWIRADHSFWETHWMDHHDFTFDHHSVRLHASRPQWALIDPNDPQAPSLFIHINGSSFKESHCLLPWLEALWFKINHSNSNLGVAHLGQSLSEIKMLENLTSDSALEQINHLMQELLFLESKHHLPFTPAFILNSRTKIKTWNENDLEAILNEGPMTSKYYPSEAIHLIETIIPSEPQELFLKRLKTFPFLSADNAQNDNVETLS